MKKLFTFSASISALIIALSFAYYFFIFLPNKQKTEQESIVRKIVSSSPTVTLSPISIALPIPMPSCKSEIIDVNQKIKIRNDKTGEIKELTIRELIAAYRPQNIPIIPPIIVDTPNKSLNCISSIVGDMTFTNCY